MMQSAAASEDICNITHSGFVPELLLYSSDCCEAYHLYLYLGKVVAWMVVATKITARTVQLVTAPNHSGDLEVLMQP